MYMRDHPPYIEAVAAMHRHEIEIALITKTLDDQTLVLARDGIRAPYVERVSLIAQRSDERYKLKLLAAKVSRMKQELHELRKEEENDVF